MIYPNTAQTAADVAGHYDELDPVYRALWGEHVHHGLWTTGRESVAEATDALADLVGETLDLRPRQGAVDIGCGYGATAARLAECYDVRVTGFTLSAEQLRVAEVRSDPRLSFQRRDWLDNGLPDAGFDRAYAIESSEHMVDKRRFFAEAFRGLKPGGRLVICAWLAGPEPSRWAVGHLLEPICREGRLPSMGSREDYEAMARAAGFALASYRDLSREVRRTWTICARRFTAKLLTDRAYRRLLSRNGAINRYFALSLPRLILAYRTGAMRYGLFAFDKPAA